MTDHTDTSLTPVQQSWEAAERDLAFGYALHRLRVLGILAAEGMIPADRFDAAYDIWGDFTRFHTHADLGTIPDEREIGRQAEILSLVATHLDEKEVLSAAAAVWAEHPVVVRDGDRLSVQWDGSALVIVRSDPTVVLLFGELQSLKDAQKRPGVCSWCGHVGDLVRTGEVDNGQERLVCLCGNGTWEPVE